MKTNESDKLSNIETLEDSLNFTRNDYNQLLNVVTFDEFLQDIADSVKDNDGTIEDAIFIANDAFEKLQ